MNSDLPELGFEFENLERFNIETATGQKIANITKKHFCCTSSPARDWKSVKHLFI